MRRAAPMPEYAFYAHDLRTNEYLADLPLVGVSFTETLNEAGSLTASLPVSATSTVIVNGKPVLAGDLLGIDAFDTEILHAATIPARSALYVSRDGILVWGGIVWSKRPSSSGTYEISASGFLSYFGKRRIREALTYTGVDQLAICRGLFQWAQAQEGGDIGLTYDSDALSGVPRDITYDPAQRTVVLEAATSLTALENGFDMRVDVQWDGVTPVRTLDLGYPRLGVPAAQSGIVWDFEAGEHPGGNVLSYTWPEDGDRMITMALGRGDLSGSTVPLLSTVVAQDLMAAGWPLLEDETSWGTVSDQGTLDEHTAAMLASRRGPAVLPTVTLGDDIAVTDYSVGDVARLNVTDPARWPSPGLSSLLRIVGRTVTVPTGETPESTEVTFSDTLELP